MGSRIQPDADRRQSRNVAPSHLPPDERHAAADWMRNAAQASREPDSGRGVLLVRLQALRRNAERPPCDRPAGGAFAGGAERALRAPAASAGERDLDQRRHKPHMVLQGRGKAFGGVPHSASPAKESCDLRLHSHLGFDIICAVNGKVYFFVHALRPSRCDAIPFVHEFVPGCQALRIFPRNVEYGIPQRRAPPRAEIAPPRTSRTASPNSGGVADAGRPNFTPRAFAADIP